MDQEILKMLEQIKQALDARPDYTILATVITVVGMLGSAWIAAWFQLRNTRLVIESEVKKTINQIGLEYSCKDKERKREVMRTSVAELLTLTDPDLHKSFDYPRIVNLIHKVQVLCDTRNAAEAGINGATTKLGLAIRSGQRDPLPILQCQTELINHCREI